MEHAGSGILWIGFLEPRSRRGEATGEGNEAQDALDGARGAERMTGESLGRRGEGTVVAEHPLQGESLGHVVGRRRGSVGVHVVHVRRTEPGVGERALDCRDRPVPARVRSRCMVGVGRAAPAGDEPEDGHSAFTGVLLRFE